MSDEGVFFDNAQWHNIPQGSLAALYCDGRFAAPSNAATVLHLPGARRITVLGDYRNASILDWEPGDVQTPATLRGFVRGRKAVSQMAIVYCDRAQAAETWNALTEGSDTNLRDYALWWISTLDEVTWPVAALAQNLASVWGAPIPESQLWANQNMPGVNGTSDRSNLFLPFR
jgi:hypothetical protein